MAAANTLSGQKLIHVDINRINGFTRFSFDLNTCLEVRRTKKDKNDELWLLYRPNGYVLSIKGNGTFDHEPKSGIDKRKSVKNQQL